MLKHAFCLFCLSFTLPALALDPGSPGNPAEFQALADSPPASKKALAKNSADYAWRAFLWLNQPTSNGGPLLWETWRQTSSVFLPDGSRPAPWGEDKPPPGLPPIPSGSEQSLCAPPGTRHNLDATLQVDGLSLDDIYGNVVRYQLLMNKPTFDYVLRREFYNVNGQEKAAATNSPGNFPPTAWELKTSWIWLGTDVRRCGELKDKYLIVNAYYQKRDNDGRPVGWEVGYAAMTGMHIINKTLPDWVWITFENNFNAAYTKIDLQLPIPADAQAANKTYQDKLRAGNSIFANYRLDGVQTTFTAPKDARDEQSARVATLLANSNIESAFQPQSSCITCHGLASITPTGKYFNMVDSRGGNVGYYVGELPDMSGYTKLDYVWSLKRASRERTASGN